MRKKYINGILLLLVLLSILLIGYQVFHSNNSTKKEPERLTIEYEQENIAILQQVDIQNILQLLSQMKISDIKGETLMYQGTYQEPHKKAKDFLVFSNGIQFGTDFYVGENQKKIIRIFQSYIESINRVEQFIENSEQITLKINDFDQEMTLDQQKKELLLSTIKNSNTSLDELPLFHIWKFPAYEICMTSKDGTERNLALSDTNKLAYYYDDELLVFSCNDSVWKLITSWYPTDKEEWNGTFKELLTSTKLLWTQNFPNVLVAKNRDFTPYIDSIVRSLNSYSYTKTTEPHIKEKEFYIQMHFINSDQDHYLTVYKNYLFYNDQWVKTNENIADTLTGIVFSS